ncbi:protein kinase [Streptomyces sp. RS10V-4]|uniref:serine/threonine-protein kinase n=1 Tax=Streptomyces rhizoryzae TaxID=2932493 RepID=UPI002005911C|nr:serine/threonine-protein kinase [Streptomyces rhizoryzae]MCK7622909.1 protein kinase [Streptomyces rhizoryzae]
MGIFGGEGRLVGGRYRLGIRLGRGGMGTVWRATDELLGRQVAVKELNLDDAAAGPGARVRRDRAMREARAVAQIKHPNVIVLHDVVEQDGRPWIVMELVEGESLADRLASGGPLAPDEAARTGRALLGALRAAHARGVLHRDLKPANVLLEDGGRRVVLTDFGIARLPGATTLTDAGGFVGSPEYTAPERMAGRTAGPEADLWSLGVLLCAALSGTTPFRRDSMAAVLHAVVYEDLELPPAVGPLADVVRGLLERDPRRRLDLDAADRLLSGPARADRRAGGGGLRGGGPVRDPFAEEPTGGRSGARPPHGGPFGVPPDDPSGEPPGGPFAKAAAAAPGDEPRPSPAAPFLPTDPFRAARTPVLSGPAAAGLPGGPAPALPGQAPPGPAAAPAPATGGRARPALLVAAAVAVLGGAAAGVAVLVAHGNGDGGTGDPAAAHPGTSAQATAHRKGQRPPRGPGGPQGVAPGAPAPTVTVTAPAAPGDGRQAPPGYRLVDDPAGFRMAVPTGFTRSYENSRVYYSSEGRRFRIGVQLQQPVPEGPLGAMRTADANGPKSYPGYRGGQVVETTHNGLRAGRWEFVWDGSARDAGARYTYDLSWNEGGRMMDVWVSSPVASRADAARQFDTAVQTFALSGR